MPTRNAATASASGGRKSYSRIGDSLSIPNLVTPQTRSFTRLVGPQWIPGSQPLPAGERTMLEELFRQVSPIKDFTGKRMELNFLDYEFKAPKMSEDEARLKDATYARPLMVKTELKMLETGEIRAQEIFMGDFPWMTSQGTFIVNGAERVVVSQLVRSPGVIFSYEVDAATIGSTRRLWGAKVIPQRGAWLEFETYRDAVYVKVDRKRRIPATALLKAFGAESDDAIVESLVPLYAALAPYGDDARLKVEGLVAATFEAERRLGKEKGSSLSRSEAFAEIYKRLRPGEPATGEAAKNFVEGLFFNERRYDLGKVGRFKVNRRLATISHTMGRQLPGATHRTLTLDDLLLIFANILFSEITNPRPDVVDHLGNRRIRGNGELIENALRIGLLRMERVIRERMSIQEDDKATPVALVNVRPVVAALKEFFGGSQLSQYMDQTNPIAELTSKRRLSALGPGGLSRERAGFDVRGIHPSHYGRICPIETPEGPNIGLIGSLSTFARINEYGFIEAPYRRVVDGAVTPELVYLAADDEEFEVIAPGDAKVGPDGRLEGEIEDRIYARTGGSFELLPLSKVTLIDVSPKQVFSVAAALVPFLENDLEQRALMGSNMMRQAVPLIDAHAPIVGTGLEGRAARDSGQVVVASEAGTVTAATSDEIVVANAAGGHTKYPLRKFVRSNQGTCLNQRPSVSVGQTVAAGDVIADSFSTEGGELALGQNVLVAYLSWEGANYEDSIIISERLVREDVYTSIHIEKYEVEARDTKLGPEEITRDIAGRTEQELAHLDADGIVTIGTAVEPGDLLVGKITPRGETDITAEERLLRAIFGEKAKKVKDSSLKMPHGARGVVVDVQVFDRTSADLSAGVNKLIRVSVAEKRKISIGDKMAGRHGNKGVVSKILPIEDMPMLADGTPVDVILNPHGVTSRLNVGQLKEAQLALALGAQGLRGETPIFDGASIDDIRNESVAAHLDPDGKAILRDGRTGRAFDQPVAVGIAYLLKLHHLVDDKIHARSVGPYSLITQQPLGGKAQRGGQRFGEMEVWALQAYGAANTLQELLTFKSDDVPGRLQAFEAIVKGEAIQPAGVPESFRVLTRELQGLGIDVQVLDEQDQQVDLTDEVAMQTYGNGALNLFGYED